ncbi:hypothetical protein CC78DRAFT_502352, partial [Lojkania enalia]
MARLRKPIHSEPAPAPPNVPVPALKQTRTSPRKAAESPVKRNTRPVSQDDEESVSMPKAPASFTPRKQRILRPVASNSRLLRRLSHESLASPEKSERTERRRGGRNGPGYLYSRSLARTVARKKEAKKVETKVETADEVEAMEEQLGQDENEEVDTSLWCRDEELIFRKEVDVFVEEEVGDREGSIREEQEEDDEDDEDDDEDPVVGVRNRQRYLNHEVVESESEWEPEIEPKPEQEPTRKPSEMPPPPLIPAKLPFQKGHSTILSWAQEVIDLTSSPEPPPSSILLPPNRSTSLAQSSSRPTSSSSNDAAAILQYIPTPTKCRSPKKAPPISRPSTPPPPPASPSRLVSPSKKQPRIPKAPNLRPSLDAFWSADVVNNWNDQHSPSKPLLSPRKQKWLKALKKQDNDIASDSDSNASFPSPTTSPKKSRSPLKANIPPNSPTVANIHAQQKSFQAKKHALAQSFLANLDTIITNGQIAQLSRSTGGIKLAWSRSLLTTAGRATWRREQLRLRTGPLSTDLKQEIRHHCTIELAEKIIVDESRLYNVLAHEFCHLTTFMISNIRNAPHGKEFKGWAKLVSDRFQHLGVQVTTKHSYEISYKFVWTCTNCLYEFKRHSRSVNPERHSCGRCRGRLVQTKPVPRGAAAAATPGGKREMSEYQVFVKRNFGRVKREMAERGVDYQMGKVMEEVAREYRETKEREK